ncbi:hypothetical protein [Streptomyces albogriseolus]
MTNGQRDQQQPQGSNSRKGIVKAGVLAAISGAFSGAARALMTYLLGEGS